MNKYYHLVICGLLGLFLAGAGTCAVAEPQNRVEERKAHKKYNAFQEKKPSANDSLVWPSVRPDPGRRDMNRRPYYRQNTARDALQSGRIKSLGVIRQRVKQSFPGKIVDVRLLEPRRKSKPYIYKVKLLRKDGKLLELKINAANARIIGVKGNK